MIVLLATGNFPAHSPFLSHGVNPDAITARTGKRQIDQFNLELLPGLMIHEEERIMHVWAGHSPPPSDPIPK